VLHGVSQLYFCKALSMVNSPIVSALPTQHNTSEKLCCYYYCYAFNVTQIVTSRDRKFNLDP